MSVKRAIKSYLEYRESCGYAENTVKSDRFALKFLSIYLKKKKLSLKEFDQKKAEQYLSSARFQNLSLTVQKTYFIVSRKFFSWLLEQEEIVRNPFEKVARLKLPSRLPRLYNKSLIYQFYQIVERETEAQEKRKRKGYWRKKALAYCYRDKALLEVIYSCGLRASEVERLDLSDVDLETKTLYARKGKWSSERVLPLTEEGKQAIVDYLSEGRSLLLDGYSEHKTTRYLVDPKALFIGEFSQRLRARSIQKIVHKWKKRLGLNVRDCVHLFRHALATQLMQNGADLRHIQALLGHKSLLATERYAHLNLSQLREEHRWSHPLGKSLKSSGRD